MIDEIIKLIDAYWKFDEHQYPMSSWHDKQDLIEAVKKVKNCNTPAVSVSVAVKEILQPKYMNDPYTWKQVQDAINQATER